MKIIKLLTTFFLFSFLALGSMGVSKAQTVKIRRVAVSPSNLQGFPSGSLSNGLRIVGRGVPVYYTCDTSGSVTSFSWGVTSKPAGSNAGFNSTTAKSVIFTPDSSGLYVITVSGNGGTVSSSDTIYASTYVGNSIYNNTNCAPCHFGNLNKYSSWAQTGHANMYMYGITGNLEVSNINGIAYGVYSPRCVSCHTTGYNVSANNGNYGYVAHQTGWDTTWYQKDSLASGEYLIRQNDMTAWNLLNTSPKYASVAPVASIGCESCHGPGNQHRSLLDVNGQYIDVTINAGVCLSCHDAPPHHTIGAYYLTSNHATMPLAGSIATSTSCFPCHSGSALVKYANNPSSPGYTSADASQDISCAACHDPHVATNFGLRPVTVTLLNGYQVSNAGNGNICMTCHHSRTNINTILQSNQAPYYGFTNRFGPHHGPQADMFYGQGGYDFGNTAIDGLSTHTGLQDACVTCHMANIGAGNSPSHQWGMIDTTGGTAHDFVVSCKSCHGQNISSFDDIQAAADYDGNGKIEGVQTEVQGLLNELSALLPKDSKNPTVPVSMSYDSLLVKNKPAVIGALWNYWFVASDNSMGVHNAKYTVAILQASIKALGGVTGVDITKTLNSTMDYTLYQNYPNPFNPSTTIKYALSSDSHVKIVVYNITGRVVQILQDGQQNSGQHEVTFNSSAAGRDLASGVYFYTIQATPLNNSSKTFTETKKMVLLK